MDSAVATGSAVHAQPVCLADFETHYFSLKLNLK